MDKAVKQLRVTTAAVPGRPDHTDIVMAYGRSLGGTVRLHADDFADFMESLRVAFPVVVTHTPPVKRVEED